VGFILPGAIIFALLYQGGPMSWILISGIAFGLFGCVNSLGLPAPEAPAKVEANQSSSRLPTARAARALGRGPVLVFCCAIFLSGLANASFVAFFPLYLTDVVGLEAQWISPITNLGVVLEIFFMLGLGWFLRCWGFKKLLVAAMICSGARMAALALFPTPLVALVTQGVHGLIVLGMMVAPVMYVNQQAEEGDRNSVQGLYTMAVVGTSRVLGSFLAGFLAKGSLPTLFSYASALTFAAALLLLFAFHDELQPQSAAT